jgi:hypothetical protein
MQLLRDEDSRAQVQQAVAQEQTTVTQFVSLLIKEEERQAADATRSADIVVTDTQCRN